MSRPSQPPASVALPLAVVTVLAATLLSATGAAAAAGPGGTPDRGARTYVAMGDSFAAGNGTGLPDLDPACRRSSLAYAPIVAAERERTDLAFVACSGATTRTVLDTQVAALDRGTDFVTLSVGGNDIGLGPIARACVLGTEAQCLGVAAQATAFTTAEMPGRLDAVYAAVGDRVRKAEVVVVGYPRFFAENFVPCQNAFGITATEAAALNDLVDTLDAVAADRAAAAGFTYVSTVDAFTGHDICAPDPWVNGIIAPTQFDAYHPSVAGYRDGYAPLVAAELETRRPSVSRAPAA